MDNVRIGSDNQGFPCTACGVSFKDNITYIDHTHTKQHLERTGQPQKVKQATLAEVRERIEWLAKQKGLF